MLSLHQSREASGELDVTSLTKLEAKVIILPSDGSLGAILLIEYIAMYRMLQGRGYGAVLTHPINVILTMHTLPPSTF